MDKIGSGSRVYIDTNVFIYFIETVPGSYPDVRAVFEHIEAVGAKIVTSELTLAECLYQPSREGNDALVELYDALFDGQSDIEMLALDGALARRAALVGGILGLKLVDAIHYTCALEAGCNFFVSGDSAFKSGPAMTVLKVAP